MAEKKNFYLTTTLPYVNADPHIGFALELVHADVIARYQKMMGKEVFFNTGTDEHGQKILQKAKEEHTDIQKYVNHYASRFEKLQNALDISNNAFIRTTAPHHITSAQELWRRCAKDIYKKKYKGLYCVGDEAYIRESELVNGRCPHHPNLELVEIEEDNYFFKLSAYQEKLLQYLGREDSIVPNWRREEAINFVNEGLEDFSISREKARMSWGIPVPDDDSQVMYVWFDALTNYISTLGWPEDEEGNFTKFWDNGEVVQMAGKDQVRFQSIMWQAMLMSASIKSTDKVVYHGFITSAGHKMSKSLGNVIDPFSLVDEYGTDAMRYYLARHASPFEDSDFTPQQYKAVYNGELANGLGNLASRIMKLSQDYEVKSEFKPEPIPPRYIDALNRFEISKAADFIWSEIARIDQEITAKEPYKLVKTDLAGGRKLIAEFVIELARINRLLPPFLPGTSKKIAKAIAENKKPESLFTRKE